MAKQGGRKQGIVSFIRPGDKKIVARRGKGKGWDNWIRKGCPMGEKTERVTIKKRIKRITTEEQSQLTLLNKSP